MAMTRQVCMLWQIKNFVFAFKTVKSCILGDICHLFPDTGSKKGSNSWNNPQKSSNNGSVWKSTAIGSLAYLCLSCTYFKTTFHFIVVSDDSDSTRISAWHLISKNKNDGTRRCWNCLMIQPWQCIWVIY